MKKLLLLLALCLSLFGCSLADQTPYPQNQLNMPENYWGNYYVVGQPDKTMTIEEHKITFETNTETIEITQAIQGAQPPFGNNLFLLDGGDIWMEWFDSNNLRFTYNTEDTPEYWMVVYRKII